MNIDEQLKDVLLQLKKVGARVTGSLARGEAHEGSDIDLRIPDSCDEVRWKKAAQIMRSTGWKLESPFVMCLSTRQSSTMLEISVLFEKTPKDKKLDFVTLISRHGEPKVAERKPKTMKTKIIILTATALAVACSVLFGQAWNLSPGQSEPRLIQCELKDGKLILSFRRETQSNVVLTSNPPQYSGPSVEIWRDIYAVSNGVIVMEKTEKANYTPAKTTTEPEKIEWPK